SRRGTAQSLSTSYQPLRPSLAARLTPLSSNQWWHFRQFLLKLGPLVCPAATDNDATTLLRPPRRRSHSNSLDRARDIRPSGITHHGLEGSGTGITRTRVSGRATWQGS